MGNDMGKMVEMLMAMLGNNESEKVNEIPDLSSETDEDLNEITEETFLSEKNDDGLQSLLGGLSGGKDKRVTLLSSIKPYMNEKRQEKVDAAINLVKLISVSSSLGFNLFEKR